MIRNDNLKQENLSAKNLHFGLVVSKWHSEITSRLHKGASETLKKYNAQSITTWEVPGSFELIYASKRMSNLHPAVRVIDAIISIGCIIRGETQHFEYVCQAVTQGIKDMNLQQGGDLSFPNPPVIFCVLTDNTMEQSIERSGGKLGNKGIECAMAAIEMAHLTKNTI